MINTSSGTAYIDLWGEPEFISANEVGETVEFIYKQTSTQQFSSYPSPPPEQRVFKIVFSCKDGKWNKSKPIYGRIIPPTPEYFEF